MSSPVLLFQKGPMTASFCLFLSCYILLNWWKHRWCAWDSNPGWLDGWRRQNHRALAAPPITFLYYSFLFLNFVSFTSFYTTALSILLFNLPLILTIASIILCTYHSCLFLSTDLCTSCPLDITFYQCPLLCCAYPVHLSLWLFSFPLLCLIHRFLSYFMKFTFSTYAYYLQLFPLSYLGRYLPFTAALIYSLPLLSFSTALSILLFNLPLILTIASIILCTYHSCLFLSTDLCTSCPLDITFYQCPLLCCAYPVHLSLWLFSFPLLCLIHRFLSYFMKFTFSTYAYYLQLFPLSYLGRYLPFTTALISSLPLLLTIASIILATFHYCSCLFLASVSCTYLLSLLLFEHHFLSTSITLFSFLLFTFLCGACISGLLFENLRPFLTNVSIILPRFLPFCLFVNFVSFILSR